MQSKGIYDCLKYWRVIRYFIKSKYNLSTAEIEMLLFLYSEDIFTKKKFEEFNKLLSWDKNRFDKLVKEGWIEIFKKRKVSTRSIFQLSFKSQRMIDSIYKKLSGEEIPTQERGNPIFKKNVKYTDKVYKQMIIEMNKSIRQQQHPSLEL